MLSSKQLLSIMFQLRKVVNHPKQIYYKKQEMRLKENNRVESATYAGELYYHHICLVCFVEILPCHAFHTSML